MAIGQSAVLIECPKSPNGIRFATYWYRIPAIPNFRICSQCFVNKIARTQFATYFENFWHSPFPGEDVFCNFNTGKTHQLFDYALQSGDLEPFTIYAARRTVSPRCPGAEGTAGGKGLRWYGIRELPDFMACETCFEEVISVSSFSRYFSPHTKHHGPDDIWACDLAIPFINRSHEAYSAAQDWSSFVNASKYRMNLEQCTGVEQLIRGRNWYTPTGHSQAMICETCFFDELLLLPGGAADQFSEFDSRRAHQGQKAQCCFARVSVKVATNRLLEKDYNRWQNVLFRIMALPPCGAELYDADLYMITDPQTKEATDFGLCESCYVGCVESSDLGYLFERRRFPGVSVCEFSSLCERMGRSVSRLTETIMTRNSKRLIDYACLSAKIHPCSRDQPNSTNCYWWGTDDFVFCAACYDEFGKDSYFATSFKHNGTFDIRPGAQCDMWSDDVRRMYLDACQQQSLDNFIPFINRWQQQMEQQMQQQQRQRQQQYRSREPSPKIPVVSPSPLWATTPEPELQNASPKGTKTAKFAKAMNVTADVLGLANAFLTGYNNAAQGQDNTYYLNGDTITYDATSHSEPVQISYDTMDYSEPAENAADPPDYSHPFQTGSHSLMSIFNETLDAHNNRWQNMEAQAVQAQSESTLKPLSVSSASSNGPQLSQKMWAQHQMNMGMLQSNAALFGMHNATMSGLNTFGSSYNNHYDSGYQSHLNGFTAGQQNMITGMAMASMYE